MTLTEIAKHYEMSLTKVMYIIQYGIAKYFKDELIKEAKEKHFTFHHDDSTTLQTKKLFDGYVKFFSKELGEVVIAYCGTLFIGRCSALDMVSHLKTFVARQNLDVI